MDKIALLCLMDTVTLDLRKILLNNATQIEIVFYGRHCLISMKTENFLLNL